MLFIFSIAVLDCKRVPNKNYLVGVHIICAVQAARIIKESSYGVIYVYSQGNHIMEYLHSITVTIKKTDVAYDFHE